MPLFVSDFLDICDPVLTFDRFMEEINLEKYLKNVPKHFTGRFRYDPVSMLKTILFGFMANGYISLRELEDSCRVSLRSAVQRHYESLTEYAAKLEEYVEKIHICGEERNSYSKTDHSATSKASTEHC